MFRRETDPPRSRLSAFSLDLDRHPIGVDDPLDDGVEVYLVVQLRNFLAVYLGSVKAEKKMRVGTANPPEPKRSQQNASEEPSAVTVAIMRHARNDGLVSIGPDLPNSPRYCFHCGNSGLIDPKGLWSLGSSYGGLGICKGEASAC